MRALSLMSLLLLVTGCPPATTVPPQPGQGADDKVELTILYTSDEHGWVAPNEVVGVLRGGVSQLLTRFTGEGHCAGAFPEVPAPDCAASHTLLLSGGDNFTGPAISTFFKGETMAGAMRRLGYTASAFGNHELDFGREQFEANRKIAGVTYLAANIRTPDGAQHDIVQPHVMIERAGARIAVIGLTTVHTPQTAAAHRFEGMQFEDPEKTLARVVPEVWALGPDAVVVIAHECHDVITPIIAEHPEWDLSFVGTGHCHRTSVEVFDGTPVIGPDWRIEHYARVRLGIDRSQAVRERADVIDYELVEVATPVAAPAPPVDPELDRRIAGWHKEVEKALGEVIGYSASGLARGSVGLGRWVVTSWLKAFDVDLAVTTDGALRQELPAGPITMASIASIMPFENELVICRATGAQLTTMLANPEAIVVGLIKKADGQLVLPNGSPIDPNKRYRIVTTDFLYHGGDHFTFHEHDRSPQMTGVNWRNPVIDWTRNAGTSEMKPLENLLVDGDP